MVALTATTPAAPAHAAVVTDPAFPLFARADCPANFFQCPASLGAAFSDVCCQNGQSCAYDAGQNPACCPSGVVCTGVAPSDAPVSHAISYVPNSYFSFPYAQTSFDDRGDCSSAASACSRNYRVCISELGGGGGGANGYGVTIAVPSGGGVTVDAGAPVTLESSSATEVCSSLSSEACGGVTATSCDAYDSGSAPGSSKLPSRRLVALVVGLLVAAWGGAVP